jgi:small subunit ribosomal protein S16
MAVKIRMKRTGAKNDACFRLVAADERSPRDGRNLETLGWYDPSAKGETFNLKLDRVDYWLGVGAQISDTAASLVKKARKTAVVAEAAPVAADA